MDVIIYSNYGYGSGVVDEIIGKRCDNLTVFDQVDMFGILGMVLTELSLGNDIHILWNEDKCE